MNRYHPQSKSAVLMSPACAVSPMPSIITSKAIIMPICKQPQTNASSAASESTNTSNPVANWKSSEIFTCGSGSFFSFLPFLPFFVVVSSSGTETTASTCASFAIRPLERLRRRLSRCKNAAASAQRVESTGRR